LAEGPRTARQDRDRQDAANTRRQVRQLHTEHRTRDQPAVQEYRSEIGMALAGLEYTTIREISGHILFVESVRGVGYGELARIRSPSGEERRGQVLEIGGGVAAVEVFGGSTCLDVGKTRVRFTGANVSLP